MEILHIRVKATKDKKEKLIQYCKRNRIDIQVINKRLGRPRKDYPNNWKEIYTTWKNGEITGRKAMEILGLKKSTFYMLVKKYESNNNQ